MIKPLIRKTTPLMMTMFALALTAGTVIAQEGEEVSSAPSGLATLVLLLGAGAIAGIFFVNWSQSAPDDSDSE